jgi:hypothetical protein
VTPHTAAADDLATTEAERACLAELRRLVGAPDGPIERHSVRVLLLAEELGRRGGHEYDRELLVCAALLHDAGLYAPGDEAYVSDGRRLTERLLSARGWDATRLEVCASAVERHHELVSQWWRGVEVELIRRADLIEISHGLIRYSVPRPTVGSIVARVPRDGFVPEVVRALVARERPRTVWRIFRP